MRGGRAGAGGREAHVLPRARRLRVRDRIDRYAARRTGATRTLAVSERELAL